MPFVIPAFPRRITVRCALNVHSRPSSLHDVVNCFLFVLVSPCNAATCRSRTSLKEHGLSQRSWKAFPRVVVHRSPSTTDVSLTYVESSLPPSKTVPGLGGRGTGCGGQRAQLSDCMNGVEEEERQQEVINRCIVF